MKLVIYMPSHIFLEETVTKVTAEDLAGSFGILPRHIDMATALVPGILSYTTATGVEVFVAVNGGILVKQSGCVSVATRMALRGALGELRRSIEATIREMDERERKTRAAVARLEADIVRRFMEFGQHA